MCSAAKEMSTLLHTGHRFFIFELVMSALGLLMSHDMQCATAVADRGVFGKITEVNNIIPVA